MYMILKVLENDRALKKEMLLDFFDEDAVTIHHELKAVTYEDRTVICYDITMLNRDSLDGYMLDEVIIDKDAEEDITAVIFNYIKSRMKDDGNI